MKLDEFAWKNPKILRKYFEFLRKKFKITKMEQWNKIQDQKIKDLGGFSFFSKIFDFNL